MDLALKPAVGRPPADLRDDELRPWHFVLSHPGLHCKMQAL
jgi:hypothetical protein